jgi:hypothetical protein
LSAATALTQQAENEEQKREVTISQILVAIVVIFLVSQSFKVRGKLMYRVFQKFLTPKSLKVRGKCIDRECQNSYLLQKTLRRVRTSGTPCKFTKKLPLAATPLEIESNGKNNHVSNFWRGKNQ